MIILRTEKKKRWEKRAEKIEEYRRKGKKNENRRKERSRKENRRVRSKNRLCFIDKTDRQTDTHK